MGRTDSYLDNDYGIGSDILKLLGAVLLLILIIIFEPFLLFWLGYFSGWLAKIFIGKYIVAWFGLFGITLSLESIPLFAGVFAWIASFFQSISSFKKKKED